MPLGLASGLTLLRPVAAGQPLRWVDVALDENVSAVRLRREMERLYSTAVVPRGEDRSRDAVRS